MSKGYIETFVDHLKAYEIDQRKLPRGEQNILATPTDAQTVFNCMIECFLGDGWYVSYPCGTGQVNTEACCEILRKHSRKFRKLMKKAREDVHHDS